MGDETIESLEKKLSPYVISEIACPHCNAPIPENSQFCNFCGYDLKNKLNPKEEFENEFRRRYKEKSSFNRKRAIITSLSVALIIISVIASSVVILIKTNNYLNSENYRIKSFIEEWRDSWENKDITKYKSFLDKDYLYIDKDGKRYNLSERVKRINYTFENYKRIKIKISNIKITPDSTSANYFNVTFQQNYVSDAVEESGRKTLRLFRSTDSDNKWKIFREYFE